MNVKVRQVVSYKGHNVSANGSVNLTLGAMYSELTGSIKLMQMLNNDVIVKAKLPDSKPMKLGMFRLKQITVNSDGTSKVKFNGTVDFVEIDNINSLPLNSDECSEFVIMYETDIEDEEEE